MNKLIRKETAETQARASAVLDIEIVVAVIFLLSTAFYFTITFFTVPSVMVIQAVTS